MTNIKPITSEEVLARQVREASSTESQPSNSTVRAPQSDRKNTAGPDATRQENRGNLPPGNSLPKQSIATKDDDMARTGFSYRLPLGAYLLAFMYMEVSAYALVIGVFSTILNMQYGATQVSPIWEIVNQNRETWIMALMCMLISIFIFSGRNILRWFVIVICSIAAVVLGYQLYAMISSVLKYDYLGEGSLLYLSSAILPGMLVLVAGVILVVVTILYLLRKKIATVYE